MFVCVCVCVWWFKLKNKISSLRFEENKFLICKNNRRMYGGPESQ